MAQDDVIQDLKQFVGSLFAQQNQVLDERFAKVDQRLDRLDDKIDAVDLKLSRKIDELTDFVTDAIDTANEANGAQLADHERRIGKLEQATATA